MSDQLRPPTPSGPGAPTLPAPSSTPKIVMRCSACGSDDIIRDAWASWDFLTQQWVLGQVFDHAYCEECEADCLIDASSD